MIIKKQLSLVLLLVTIFALTTSIEASQGPAPVPNAPAPAQPEATLEEQLKEAKKNYWDQKAKTNKASHELQERINSFSGYSQQAVARELFAFGFRLADRGITYGIDEARKTYIGLTEEEILAKEIRQLEADVQKESLKAALLNNELTISSKETKSAEKALIDSQRLQQEIANTIALCSHMPQRFDNPECIRHLKELAAQAGMKLD